MMMSQFSALGTKLGTHSSDLWEFRNQFRKRFR
jgi:hypothetical protein